ncbi:MAG TPA: ribonuclease Z [Candidatus Cloacimonadota bacterium]|nr:ribonuclease Z [Candidatus Cloacimonadota bacterium]HPS38390.1 ribonuclease Z [Candidatus Cloacimonadota bacterium]
MKLTILGSGPGLPQLDKHLSSMYVEAEDKHILMDCGEGVSHQLLRYGLSGNKLDLIIITHYHPDHVTGVFMLLQMLYLEGRTKPLHLFVPERPEFILETMHAMYTFESKFPFDLKILLPEQIEEFYPFICAHPTDHLLGYGQLVRKYELANTMRSWAYRIRGAEGDLVYTADISTTSCIAGLLSDAHTVIADSLHPMAEQILRLPEYGVKRVILNHGISAELAGKLAAMPDPIFEPAQEDHVYTI